MQVNISPLEAQPIADRPIEIAERKGLGHPDSICDALAEQVSLALCRFYRERFGLILHHNVDKVLLCAGETRPAFGGGEVVKPLDIFLAGRATAAFKGVEVPLEELAVETTRQWLAENLRGIQPERHVRLHALIRPGSPELVELYLRGQEDGLWLANDTSCGVGFAPLSALERVVLGVEQRLNHRAAKKDHPECGEDIKVMGVRRGGEITLTVACAMIGGCLKDPHDYARKVAGLRERARAIAGDLCGVAVDVQVNAADDPSRGSYYLTVTGTSGEAGDDGEAGRGNRANGLITPYRPMTMESVAGKNPVTHVGKLYNLTACLLAEAVVEELAEVTSAHCSLVSQIGRPIDQPQIVDLGVRTADGRPLADLAPAIGEILHHQLGRIPALADSLLSGRLALDRWPLRAD